MGNNFESVDAVELVDISDQPIGKSAVIVSKARKEMVITMPAGVQQTRVKLKLSNSSSEVIAPLNFVNIDKATLIFTDDYAPGIENWSWGTDNANTVTTEQHLMGTASLKMETGTGSYLRLVKNTPEQKIND